MGDEPDDKPTPTTDEEQPDRAPGGQDAAPTDLDLSSPREEEPLVADQPLSAQQDEEIVPDEIQTPEEMDDPDEDDPEADEPA